MSLPVTIPFTFGNATTAQSLSSLDNNFTTIVNAVNGLTNGASQINVASISATGTANSTTFLRGDGTWGTPAGGGGGSGTVTSIDVNGGTTGLTTSGGPVTTSGNITIAGTLIPANGGTGLTAVGASGNVLTSNGTGWISKAPTTALQSAKVWANWSGSTGTIASSYNVSSVTKNATGDYTVAFTSAMTDANYAPIATTSGDVTYGTGGIYASLKNAPTTTSCSIIARGYSGGTAYDPVSLFLVIFGN